MQTRDNAIQSTNCYPVNQCRQTQPRYPLDSDLSDGKRYPPFEQLAPGQNMIVMVT